MCERLITHATQQAVTNRFCTTLAFTRIVSTTSSTLSCPPFEIRSIAEALLFCTAELVFTELPIPNIDPLSFEGRLIMGGRTGGAFVETWVDCVQIEAIQGALFQMTEIIYDENSDEITLKESA